MCRNAEKQRSCICKCFNLNGFQLRNSWIIKREFGGCETHVEKIQKARGEGNSL